MPFILNECNDYYIYRMSLLSDDIKKQKSNHSNKCWKNERNENLQKKKNNNNDEINV